MKIIIICFKLAPFAGNAKIKPNEDYSVSVEKGNEQRFNVKTRSY